MQLALLEQLPTQVPRVRPDQAEVLSVLLVPREPLVRKADRLVRPVYEESLVQLVLQDQLEVLDPQGVQA